MRRWITALAVVGLVAGQSIVSGGPLAAPAFAGAATSKKPVYVALGDSYASGEGLGPYEKGTDVAPTGKVNTNKAKNLCHRSAGQGYGSSVTSPVVLPNVPKADRAFWACSGALAADMTPIADVPGHSNRAAPGQRKLGDATYQAGQGWQTDQVSAATRYVSISAGGNDIDFAGLVSNCMAAYDTTTKKVTRFQHTEKSCSTAVSAALKLMNTSPSAPSELARRLTILYTAILNRASSSQLVVVGYPAALPSTLPKGRTFCALNAVGGIQAGFTYGDAASLRRVVDTLNASAAEVVSKLGATRTYRGRITFADTAKASTRHNCTGSTPGVSVNGLVGSPPKKTNTLWIIGPGSLHPTAGGQAMMARQVQLAFTGLQPGQRSPVGTVETLSDPTTGLPIASLPGGRFLSTDGFDGGRLILDDGRTDHSRSALSLPGQVSTKVAGTSVFILVQPASSGSDAILARWSSGSQQAVQLARIAGAVYYGPDAVSVAFVPGVFGLVVQVETGTSCRLESYDTGGVLLAAVARPCGRYWSGGAGTVASADPFGTPSSLKVAGPIMAEPYDWYNRVQMLSRATLQPIRTVQVTGFDGNQPTAGMSDGSIVLAKPALPGNTCQSLFRLSTGGQLSLIAGTEQGAAVYGGATSCWYSQLAATAKGGVIATFSSAKGGGVVRTNVVGRAVRVKLGTSGVIMAAESAGDAGGRAVTAYQIKVDCGANRSCYTTYLDLQDTTGRVTRTYSSGELGGAPTGLVVGDGVLGMELERQDGNGLSYVHGSVLQVDGLTRPGWS